MKLREIVSAMYPTVRYYRVRDDRLGGYDPRIRGADLRRQIIDVGADWDNWPGIAADENDYDIEEVD